MNTKLTIANMKLSSTMTDQPAGETFVAISYTLVDLNAVMTAEEIVIEYGATVEDVYRAVAQQQIPARRSGSTWLVRRADAIRRWFTEGAGRSLVLTGIVLVVVATAATL